MKVKNQFKWYTYLRLLYQWYFGYFGIELNGLLAELYAMNYSRKMRIKNRVFFNNNFDWFLRICKEELLYKKVGEEKFLAMTKWDILRYPL